MYHAALRYRLAGIVYIFSRRDRYLTNLTINLSALFSSPFWPLDRGCDSAETAVCYLLNE